MGFKIKNSLTGEFEKLPILTLKGEKGETGGVEEYNKVDYMGNKYETLKQANDANVEYAVKTAIGEFNYLDYDGQHITATDTIEGRSKSAILKGNTLVNVFKRDFSKTFSNHLELLTDGWFKVTANGQVRYMFTELENNPIKPNTKYLVKFEFRNNTLVTSNQNCIMVFGSSGVLADTGITIKPVNQTHIITTKENFEGKSWVLDAYLNTVASSGSVEIRINIIEYQEGMENWDIPYFEGMQSVKMPVLKSVGKNLVDDTALKTANLSEVPITDLAPIKVEPNKSYYVGLTLQDGKDASTQYFTAEYKDENGIVVAAKYHNHVISFTEEQAQKIKTINIFTNKQHGYSSAFVEHLWVVESSEAVPYEPHKSNILTTPEDLELRGIGDVKDELNVATGELAQRIDEVVLDDSNVENWRTCETKGEYLVAKFTLPSNALSNGGAIPSVNIKCDKMRVGTVSQEGSQEQISIYYHSVNGNYSELRLCLLTSKLTSADIEGIRTYVKNNPFTIQYQLKTESVKTVDLSDNHVYSYKGTTHYDCSSAEGSLVPTLSVKVPTDVQATIAQQRETIQTLNSENERLNQIQEALKASMLDSQVQLMNISWNTDFEVFTLRESIAPKDFLLASRTGSNIDKFSQAKFIIENDCPDLEKLNSQIEYYFSKDVFSQEQFEELTDLISIVKGENGCEY